MDERRVGGDIDDQIDGWRGSQTNDGLRDECLAGFMNLQCPEPNQFPPFSPLLRPTLPCSGQMTSACWWSLPVGQP